MLYYEDVHIIIAINPVKFLSLFNMAAHSRPMTDFFLTQTEILTETSESAASVSPEKLILLSPGAEKQEHEMAILYKEVSHRNGLLNFPGFVLLIKLATCTVTFAQFLNWSGQPQLLMCCE